MSQGYGFAGFNMPQKISRLPKNPIDKCTIVSVYPREIVEIKHTISPPKYVIPAAPENGYSLLVVESAIWLKEMPDDAPLQEMYVGSMILAQSIITDYSNGLFAAGAGRGPGLFFIPGAYDKKSIKLYVTPDMVTFSDLLKRANDMQRNWYTTLITQTNAVWARSNGNPLCVSEDAKLAARELNINPDWMQDFKLINMSNCQACGTIVNPSYPICPNCKAVVNQDLAKERDIKFAVN